MDIFYPYAVLGDERSYIYVIDTQQNIIVTFFELESKFSYQN